MNTITRTALAAAPLAFAALTLAPGAANATSPAFEPSFDIAAAPGPVGPKGPGDITTPPVGPQPPKGPGDITSPTPGPKPPTGPGDLTAPTPCPTHGSCGNGGDTPDGDTPDGGTPDGGGFDVPTRIDAGIASQGEDDTVLSWTLVGGAIVLASGAAFSASRQRRTA